MATIRESLSVLFKSVDDLGLLEKGWDSYGALAIPEEAREDTKKFLSILADLNPDAAAPDIVGPHPWGSVLIVWGKESEIEVLVGEDSVQFSAEGIVSEEMSLPPGDVEFAARKISGHLAQWKTRA